MSEIAGIQIVSLMFLSMVWHFLLQNIKENWFLFKTEWRLIFTINSSYLRSEDWEIGAFLYLEQNVWSAGDIVRGGVSAWHTNGSLIRILRARQDGLVKLVHANRVGELVNSPRVPQSFIWLLLVCHGRIDLTAAIWEMSLKLFFRCLNSNG